MSREELERRIRDYKWYHAIEVAPGLATPGMQINVPSQQKSLRALRGLDLRGKSVLDIGCRDGLFSFEAEKLGAARVVGIDNDLSPGATELLIPALGSRVEMRQLNLFDLRPETFGRFDVVLFLGTLYHLRYPFRALKLMRNVLADHGVMVIETAVIADANRHALLYCPVGAENPYDETSVTLFNMKGLKDTLATLELRATGEELQCGFKPDPEGDKLVVDRVTLVCRRDATLVKAKVAAYWDGVHDLHATGATSFE